MESDINGGPAFPGQWYDFQPYTGDQVVREQWEGMTLRDYFAAKAMPALIQLFTTGDLTAKDGRPATEEHIAEQAYCFADAMLAQRAKEQA